MNFLTTVKTTLQKSGAKSWTFIRRHKIISGIVVLILIGGGYMGYHALAAGTAGTEYALAATTEAPLDVSVTGSGQVTANDTLNLSPKASGQITSINVKVGQTVKAGTLIATIDATDAVNAVTTARENLESAQISYQQTLTSTANTSTNDQTSVQSSLTSGVSALSSTYANLPSVMIGFNSVLNDLSPIPGYTAQTNADAYANYVHSTQSAQYEQAAKAAYQTAVAAYQTTRTEYEGLDANSVSDTSSALDDSIDTTKKLSAAIQATLAYYNYIDAQAQNSNTSVPSALTTQIASLNSYLSTVNGDTSSLSSAYSSLNSDEQAVQKDQQSLTGNTPLDVQSAQLDLQKAQDALAQAEQAESDYVVRAPFDGTIATVPVNVYDQASAGTAVATLITTGNYVDLSINEADIAKILVGQPASLTFDAIDGLTATGTVAEVDPVGTVSQGVVTYTVKVGLTTVDDRIKPGMTADATIVTASVPSAIQVPSAAVHTANGSSYVEVATLTNASSTAAGMGARTGTSTRAYGTGGAGAYGAASSTRRFTMGSSTAARSGSSTGAIGTSRSLTVPATSVTITRVPVVTGISNDTMIQIESGLRPGQLVVTSTVTGSTAKKTTTTSTGLFGGLFGGGARTTGAAGGTGARTYGAGATGAARTSGAAAGGYGGGTGGGFSGGGAPAGG